MAKDFSSRFSREPVTEIRGTTRAARYFISQVREWTDRVGVNKTTVSDAEKEYKGKEIPELEGLVLSRPENWQNIPERWLALANVLEKKYEARNNKKKLQ
ncbi:hypothetical protein A3C20_02915 [Candidatus Kaiserbacteria bacterium RIFCSPHIGHO2_02_FULL_55_25]|uniref:Uncharacterized protein n=2 Tax=Parcubacteria group TaxID=1794811 RepID=A0A1F4Y0K4_9BACT|nr:MAG: hypothetical protein A3B33_02530 [Candidatus Adlerbacteria bacterium RIFCSPLOWO2_01_FULL_54_16]OGG53106.1 MAG: hypothetical protein A2764_02525 [Candidatus Kaiserbacteria bacterium RIFCSPHIGHO2_01_FULL_55_79]OGG68888.1 MAG: hypothetical protein A3C20_02915 [Candidatus Kaiserbacteria bacterium RIFCSPHIGHO2_02_FULL_55_25]OGG77430.1 MAG: hypothetical protein A3F56_02155 [Candidatus Kaiserbacteria bacterium RIFCSPHIGHO2_12_FULL_55_13]